MLVMYYLVWMYILKVLVTKSDRSLGISKKLTGYLSAVVVKSKEKGNFYILSQENW